MRCAKWARIGFLCVEVNKLLAFVMVWMVVSMIMNWGSAVLMKLL
jgi:hypothetical protein